MLSGLPVVVIVVIRFMTIAGVKVVLTSMKHLVAAIIVRAVIVVFYCCDL